MNLFKTLFIASLKSQTQYKFDFIVSIVGNFLGMLSDFLVLAIILLRFKTIGDWQLHEIALIYGVIEFGFGVYRIVGDGFNNFEDLVLSGKLDTLLIRPIPVIVQVMLQKMDFRRLGAVMQALAVGIWGLSKSEFVHPGIAYYMPVMLIASVLVNLFLSIILAAIAFWTGKNEDIIILGHYSTKAAANYPAEIYHAFFQKILIFVIPLYTVSYFPVQYFTGKSDNIYYLLTPLYGVVVMGLFASFIWSKGLKRYSSAGT